MKIVVAPDSFKGTMSALTVCETIRRALLDRDPSHTVVCLPVADGGEGTVACFHAARPSFQLMTCEVKDLYQRPKTATFCFDGTTAVVETASAAGLDHEYLHVCEATSYGVGDVIRHALDLGAEKILLGLGGSGTTDCGMGMAAALGVRFTDENGQTVPLCGNGLHKVAHIDVSGLDKRLKKGVLTAACDVKIPLCGPDGTAHGYSAQKGATREEILWLDEGLCHITEIAKRDLGVDLDVRDGSGAAGGLGAAVRGFLNGELVPGIDMVLESVEFEKHVKDADLVLTGEGCADAQSVSGKVPVGVAGIARRYGVPVICLCGKRGDGYEKLYEKGIDRVVSINPEGITFEEARKACEENLYRTVNALAFSKRV